ncbi:DUF2057 family protein [Pseudomonas lundensis]|uniref:DUF2057 family protein n=1 Tax=Serratia proteamaculans TaxID=28151 RepID=UPI002981EBE5|nr:DUF2057 family protein [Serratia proteamaculans]MDW5499829.1 DUF2057 family protein [Serratia proteamaculans]MDW5504894.1 DUF2057 family protein [Pseudomonas lundensis]
MKFGLMVAGLLSISISMPAVATTLKLSPDIDLLVVDGKKMTGSLLKGADSLELDGGQHQLLFKVVKSVRSGQNDQATYTSPPLIATFNTQNVSSVAIELPRIENTRDSQRFDKTLNYQVIDKNGNPLAMKHDVLHPDSVTLSIDLEKVMADYNSQKRPASVAAFTHVRAAIPPSPLASAALNAPTVTLKGENVSEQMLQYWFQQADKETQKRFLHWANKQAVH